MPRIQQLVREAREQGVPEDQCLNWALDRWQREQKRILLSTEIDPELARELDPQPNPNTRH